MKTKTIFICEKCGTESSVQEYVELCEARHFGLYSVEDYRKWQLLNTYAKACTVKLSTTSNEKLRQEEEKAYAELLAFEKEHNMNV